MAGLLACIGHSCSEPGTGIQGANEDSRAATTENPGVGGSIFSLVPPYVSDRSGRGMRELHPFKRVL